MEIQLQNPPLGEVVGGKIAVGVDIEGHQGTTIDIGRESATDFSARAYNPIIGAFLMRKFTIEGIPLFTNIDIQLAGELSGNPSHNFIRKNIPEKVIEAVLVSLNTELKRYTSKLSRSNPRTQEGVKV
ncbi:hypothetical protein KBC86_05020 [Candidatus Gracilibacteria bacterium]|nr:hypothetical protein [Candidatus Gracilibacteria bacterium]